MVVNKMEQKLNEYEREKQKVLSNKLLNGIVDYNAVLGKCGTETKISKTS